MCHNRYFLKMINQLIEPSEKCGIQKQLHDNHVLDHFKQLITKDRYFKRKTDESSSDDEEGVPVVFHCIPPPSKKPKT